MELIHISSGGNVVRYKGFLFEWHRYCGPIRLKEDGEAYAESGQTAKFLDAAMEWDRLSCKSEYIVRYQGDCRGYAK